MSRWTDLKAIKAKLDRHWQSGDLLRALRRPESLFPLRLPLKQPTSSEMSDCFVEVRDWVQAWQACETNTDLALEWRTVQHRQVGRDALPCAVLLDTPEQALRLLRRQTGADCFHSLCAPLLDAFPELDDWIDRNPLKVLELADLNIPVEDFVRLNPAVERVLVVENEITALAFPNLQSAIVVIGMGYGIDRHLARVDWLADKTVLYWGDIDTHGFQILNRVQAALPQTRSLLMDRATLMAHQPLWGREPKPIHHDLPYLNPHEQALYRELVDNRLGDRVRLEQERIGFKRLRQVLDAG